MTASLQKILFDAELLPLVQDFDCRSCRDRPAHPWEAEINDWIKADPATRDGALYYIANQKKGCKVWLYTQDREDEGYDIVGYGSLACSSWPDPSQPWETPGLARVPISLIPALGIQTPFQKGPPGAEKHEKYSSQILQHLIWEARQKLTERQPFLGLYVHPDNVGAIKCYRANGFEDFAQTYKDPSSGTVYRSMILSLRLLSKMKR